MRYATLTRAWRPLWLLALCGCAASGPVAKPAICPEPQPLPPRLLNSSNFERRLQNELYESVPKPTPANENSRKP